ncbi:hypothetical protein [uncultured Mediterranean phage uvMED]|nr:hypothetical protein [uncultured Mediterranean phage uvMED]
MATHDYVIANGTGNAVRSDLNNALAAIVSNNSSSSEPSTKYAYQWWADTTTGQLKLRNSANNAWVTIFELDGTMLMEDGTAAAPGLAFASDLNTGIFRPSADKINFATGGVELLEIGSDGVVFNDPGNDVNFRVESSGSINMLFVDGGNDRVGIGTASPSTMLHVAGTTRIGANSTGDAELQIGAGATGNRNALIDLVGDTTYTDYGFRVLRESGGPNTGSRLIHRGTGDFRVIAQEAAPIQFWTSNTERMRIDSSGRLLVGTSSARANFNDGTDSSHIQLEGTTQNTSTISTVRNSNNDGPSHLVLGKSRGAAANSTTIVQSGDTIGHINFEGADGSHLIRAAQISAVVDGTPGANDMPGRLVFSTCADGAASLTERMRIRSGTTGGLILAGRATSVSANATLGIDTASGVAGIVSETGPTSGIDHIRFFNGNGNVGNITTSGGATAYNTSSDYRLKENVVDIADGITRIKQLSPKRFNFIVDADTTVDGFLAHEAQTVVPEAVTGTHDEVDSDGNPEYQGIDQSKLVPLLTAALQEAITKIETLETKVAALEAG